MAPPPPLAPATREPEKKKRHTLRWVLIGIAVIVAISAVASGGSKNDTTNTSTGGDTPAAQSGDNGSSDAGSSSYDPKKYGSGTAEHPAADDVELSTCTNDEYSVKAAGTITNHSSKASDYMIKVEFVNAAGTRFGDGLDYQTDVAPAQSSEWDAMDMPSNVTPGFTCRIVDVERTASN